MNVAAVDIGTNSVRLLITDGEGRELERHMRITKLGEGVDVARALQPAAMKRTLAVLADYGALITRHAAQRVRAAATSAARDADNREQFFDAAETALHCRPQLLSGEEEASLSFRGATTDLDRSAGPFLVVDIGGGSTEFVLGSDAPSALISVPLGCVRMTERHLKSDPPTPAELAACLDDVRGVLATVARTVPVQDAKLMVGLAGTITSLAGLRLGLSHYDPAQTHHSRLTRADVERMFLQLSAATIDRRRQLLAEPKRGEVIVGGVAVLVTIMREFAIDALLVSETDILDGLAASLRGAPQSAAKQ